MTGLNYTTQRKVSQFCRGVITDVKIVINSTSETEGVCTGHL